MNSPLKTTSINQNLILEFIPSDEGCTGCHFKGRPEVGTGNCKKAYSFGYASMPCSIPVSGIFVEVAA